MALTAPSLCPRCDAPALTRDECAQCALPLRHCGSCQGVAGPFDRFCGFCGHELVLGRKESPGRRLWLVAGLVPILAALAIGLSPIGQAAVRGVTGGGGSTPPAKANLLDTAVGFTATKPAGWSYSHDTSLRYGVIGASAQGWPAMTLGTPNGTVIELGRPAINEPGVDAHDPTAVLASETSRLLGAPPPGLTLASTSPVKSITVNGRHGAETIVSVTGSGGATSLFLKAYLAGPSGLFLFEAVCPQADLARVEAVLSSLRLTS